MKDARWFPLAAAYAAAGSLLHNRILSSMGAAAQAITAGTGFALAWFLLMVAVLSVPPLLRKRVRGEHSRVRVGSAVVLGMAALAFCHVLFLPVGLFRTVWNGAWGLLPLLIVAQVMGLAALAGLLWQRPWRRPGPGTEGGGQEAPKLVGVRDPSRMPPGWVPVVVHRPEGYMNLFVDHPLEVDGDRIGELAPGETLVVGLPPGDHTARVPSAHLLAGPPFRLTAVPGSVVHLFVTEQGQIAPWNPPVLRQGHPA